MLQSADQWDGEMRTLTYVEVPQRKPYKSHPANERRGLEAFPSLPAILQTTGNAFNQSSPINRSINMRWRICSTHVAQSCCSTLLPDN
jgi:hypothetical protein